MLCNRLKSPNPLSTLAVASFPTVMAITVAILLLLCLTFPSRNARLRISDSSEGKCGSVTLRTIALYFEHSGDEDKPVDPLIIAASSPSKEEIQCAVPRTLDVGSHWNLLVVKEEEFSHAATLLKQNVPTHQPDPQADFQYVLVSQSGKVQRGPFSDQEAASLFEDLARYFEKRQPELQQKLEILIRRLGGPQQSL
ncbi:MAG TPA: hypothetical protein VJP02_04290 [Candidatus Sulfotelmatobacter sp.]|nr:hypothetical protein [Candidatus Sulfotelmatobacter sp.]